MKIVLKMSAHVCIVLYSVVRIQISVGGVGGVVQCSLTHSALWDRVTPSLSFREIHE